MHLVPGWCADLPTALTHWSPSLGACYPLGTMLAFRVRRGPVVCWHVSRWYSGRVVWAAPRYLTATTHLPGLKTVWESPHLHTWDLYFRGNRSCMSKILASPPACPRECAFLGLPPSSARCVSVDVKLAVSPSNFRPRRGAAYLWVPLSREVRAAPSAVSAGQSKLVSPTCCWAQWFRGKADVSTN